MTALTSTTATGGYLQTTRKRGMILFGGALVLLLAVLADLFVGPGNYSPAEVIGTLFAPEAYGVRMEVIVWDLRLPVALTAVLVGVMLGIAGAQMQTILGNPLADPFTLGISSAASFGAALAIVLGIGLIPVAGHLLVTANAFLFALLTSGMLYFITRLRGVSAETMILVGIALLFTFNSLLALLQYGASEVQLQQVVFWMMGSLGRASWEKILAASVLLVVLLPLMVHRRWGLTALRLGDDKASSLGVNVVRLRIEMLICISLLAATSVSFVGTVGFVGLVGPHIARMLVGEDQRFFLPLSGICGGAILSIASTVSKAVVPGVIYPIGIITSLFGIPFFISLVMKSRRRIW
jgi:iron complex transport system permease protein